MQAPCSPLQADSQKLQRAVGALRLQVGLRDGRSVLRSLYQQAPCRALMPDRLPEGPFEAVLVNSSGGLVGGDRLGFEIAVEPNTAASLVSQAAEKVYRSSGADTLVETRLSAGAGAWLEWLPQETILFDGARLRRKLVATLDPAARLLAAELVLFGRAAHGESFSRGFLHDSWAIRSGSRLAWTDAIRLEGDIAAERARPFGFGRAAGYATLLYAGPQAASFLPVAREVAEGGATLVNGLLLLRFLAEDGASLRRAVVQAAGRLRNEIAGLQETLPRVWQV